MPFVEPEPNLIGLSVIPTLYKIFSVSTKHITQKGNIVKDYN